MTRKYTIESFRKLELDSKIFIIQYFLFTDYIHRQTELFSLDEGVEYTEEIAKEHDVLLEVLVEEVTVKLFADKSEIIYDLEKEMLKYRSENEVFYNRLDNEDFLTLKPDDSFFDVKLN